MKKIIFITLILTIILYTPFELFHDSLNYFLSSCNITNKCYKGKEGGFLDIFKQEGFDYINNDQAITKASLEKLLSIDKIANKFSIPAISHHIYFFPSKNAIKINDYIIEIANNSISRLDNASDIHWTHYIWTNNQELLLNDFSHNKHIIFKNIEEFDNHPLYQHLFAAVSSNEITRFSEASDLLRFMALQKYGGLYMDMDYEIYNAKLMTKLLQKFDFIGGRESAKSLSYYGSAFIAAKADHPILNEMIQKEIRNNDTKNIDRPNYVKYPCYSSYRILFNALPVVTLSYMAKNNIDSNNDIILPSWMLYNWGLARYKNSDCKYSGITLETFKQRNKNIENILKDFNSNLDDNSAGNIYYSYKDHHDFDIIGADMFCTTWAGSKQRLYHFTWK